MPTLWAIIHAVSGFENAERHPPLLASGGRLEHHPTQAREKERKKRKRKKKRRKIRKKKKKKKREEYTDFVKIHSVGVLGACWQSVCRSVVLQLGRRVLTCSLRLSGVGRSNE
jgi:preprotein translocase subunit Sss1